MRADSDRIPGVLPPRTHPWTEVNGEISPLKFPTPDGETQLGWGDPSIPVGELQKIKSSRASVQ